MLIQIALATLLTLSAYASTDQKVMQTLPPTAAKPVVDDYYGTKISDPYRWLEDSANPEVKKWTEMQSAYTRSYLDTLPELEKIKAKLKEWNDFQSSSYGAVTFFKGQYFALKLQPPQNQPMLVTLPALNDLSQERVIVDPNSIDAGGTTTIDFYQPSLDGKYLAVSLSKGGSEIGTLHIYETKTGKELADQIPMITKPTAGGSVAWNKDASGFFYTRYPSAGERPQEDMDFYQQIYFHKMGDPLEKDSYALGKDFPRIAEIKLSTSFDGSVVLASVANGDGGEFAHYIFQADKTWKPITKFEDKVKLAVLGRHNDIYLLSTAGAPRGKILNLELAQPELKNAKIVVKESPVVIEDFLPTPNLLYVLDLVGGPSDIRVFNLVDQPQKSIAVEPLSNISSLNYVSGDNVVFRDQSYVQPSAWFEYSPKTGLKKTAMVKKTPVEFNDIEVKRETAKGKDGTPIPVTVLYRKGLKRDGNNPTLLYGYGGYGISMTPRFNPDLHLFLQQGGVYAVANIRGGGEFGENWHLSGNLTKKQNVFDDFVASAQHLIKSHYTNPKKLAIEGGSNGGLLMGATLTQHPELFQAVVSHVGIYDMLRVETDPNGAFNVTEFGSVKNPDQFKALLAYSPYHHIEDKKSYPATLLLTGANDGRVNPYHSKKMVARLQSVNNSKKPMLLRVTFDGGHGMGRSVAQKISEEADVYSFLFSELGMKY